MSPSVWFTLTMVWGHALVYNVMAALKYSKSFWPGELHSDVKVYASCS